MTDTQTPTQPPPGATLHLGGTAYASPTLEPLLVSITDAKPYPGNPRRHDQDSITASVRDHGLYQGVVLQRTTGHVLVGNGRLQALTDLGAERVPVTWLDVDDARAAAIVVRDNHTSDLSWNDTQDLVNLLAPLTVDPDLLALSGHTQDDYNDLLLMLQDEEPEGPEYTRKVDAIQYHPTSEEPPPVTTLVDRTKANDLIRQIGDVDLPPDVRDFLVAGAQRHLVFDYSRVAEFYAHAEPHVQRLMEASTLVIVDFEDAIHNGYVRLSDRLRTLLDLDATERAAIDAAGVSGA